MEVAVLWAILTFPEQPKHVNLTLLRKRKLCNGKMLPGFIENNIIQLKREAMNWGRHGIIPRCI